MIAAQRRALILEYLRQNGAGSIVDIADSIGTSRSSTRRDLDFLAEGGAILRSRGGAVVNEQHRTTFEPPRRIVAQVAHAEKAAIGRVAADMLQAGQSVIFDSSSTVLEAARRAVERNLRLTACTNDIGIAQILSAATSMQTIVLGGTVRPDSLTLVGDPGVSFLDRLHADVALIGIHSLAGARLSETSIELGAIKRRMIACATKAVVLADSTKFAHPAFCDVCDFEEIDVIVSDRGLSSERQAQVRDAGVELVLAEP